MRRAEKWKGRAGRTGGGRKKEQAHLTDHPHSSLIGGEREAAHFTPLAGPRAGEKGSWASFANESCNCVICH